MFEEAAVFKSLCRTTLFVVNDRIDIALAIDADGVHIGQDDMPYEAVRRLLGKDRIIGVTVHTPAEARDAEVAGADYLGVSPIFPTGTKLDAGDAIGTNGLATIARAAGIPVVAIGGITLANAPDVIAAGAHAICAISAVVASDDPCREMKRFMALFG
jgi:thiamine-phosphate pyrophosphorylase